MLVFAEPVHVVAGTNAVEVDSHVHAVAGYRCNQRAASDLDFQKTEIFPTIDVFTGQNKSPSRR